MTDGLHGAGHRQELVRVIREARSRWRTKSLLRGGIVIVGGALLALVLASVGLQATKFSPSSVLWLRVGIFAIFAGLIAGWLVRPMRRTVSDHQVALYLEEHEPKLQAAILGAVHIGAVGSGATPEDVPQVILDRMIEQAVEKARSIEAAARSAGRRCAATRSS
jgi:hypothetical protein